MAPNKLMSKLAYALQDQQAETIVRAQPLVTTHSESVPLQILPLMGSDQISANSSEGSVVIRGQYFGSLITYSKDCGES